VSRGRRATLALRLSLSTLGSKLTSVIVSLFAATYVLRWAEHLPGTTLQSAPAFDARAVRSNLRLLCRGAHICTQVCYPSDTLLRDYLCWRQADCHINNQYNAVFWALVAAGRSREEAQARLAGTLADEKNEILFSEHGTNYAALPARHRRGSVLHRLRQQTVVKTQPDGTPVSRLRTRVVVEHVDIIADGWWEDHPHLLAE
jgi:tRNA(His) guanylyltransferase